MKKPVIGITPSHNTDNDEISVRPTYLRAIEAAGGLSILLPLEVSAEDLKQLSGLCDGFLFSGGPDIHPFLLREETHMHCGNVSVARDTMELSLLKLAMEAKNRSWESAAEPGHQCRPGRRHLSGYYQPGRNRLSHCP